MIMKCEDKMTFDDKKQAQNAAVVAAHQRGAKLKAYHCNHCDLWHLSSNYGDSDND